MRYSPDDRHIVTLTLIGEARGEGVEGMRWVAHVLRNRSIGRHLQPWEVCLQPMQFSCWNAHPDNLRNLRTMAAMLPSSAIYVDAGRIFDRVFEGDDPDPTGRANHYLVTALEPKPRWFDAAKITGVCGHHSFLRL